MYQNVNSEFQWAFALSSGQHDSKVMHLLDMVTILEVPLQLGVDSVLACISIEIQNF